MILKFKKGFSLVELLVVIAIIGILAAVGITAYQGYTTGAKEKAVLANQKQLVTLINAEMAKCASGSGNYPWGKYNTGNRKDGNIAWDGLDNCDRTTNGDDTGDFVSGQVSAEAIVDYINNEIQLKNPWDNTSTEVAITLDTDWADTVQDDVGKILISCAAYGHTNSGSCKLVSRINKEADGSALSTEVEIIYY